MNQDRDRGRSFFQSIEPSRVLRHIQLPTWIGYIVAIVLVIIITVVLLLLQMYLPLGRFPIPYVLAVGLVAYFFGIGPAILAFLLGIIAYHYYFTAPIGKLWPLADNPIDWAGWVAFLLGTSLVVSGMILIRRAEKNAREALSLAEKEVMERTAVAQALLRSEARFRAVFDYAGMGMTVIGIHGNVTNANPAFAKFIGYSQEELTRMNVKQYAHPDDLEETNELLREMVEGKRDFFQEEKRYVRKDGKVVWGRLTASIARNPAPEPPFIIGMVEDITERKQWEERECELEQEKLEFYRRTILAATNGKLLLCNPSDVDALDGQLLATWEVKDPYDLSTIRGEITEIARSEGMEESRMSEFAIAAGEAVTNVIKHAVGGVVSLYKKEDGLILRVSDRGPGIPALALPDVALRERFSTVGTLGMGYKIIISLADLICLSTGPEGTIVAIEKKFRPVAPQIPEVGMIGLDSRS